MPFPIALATTLIPLVADVLPPLVRFLVGNKAADAVQQTTDAANAIATAASNVLNMPVQSPEDVAQARAKLNADPVLMAQLRNELVRLDAELARVELERDKAYLQDVQDARASQAVRGDTRANIMLLSAFAAVIAIVALLVISPNVEPTIKGFIIGIGGMFARNIGSAFDFEFGSSRGSKNKEQQLGAELKNARRAVAEQAYNSSKVGQAATLIKQTVNAVDTLKNKMANS